MAADQIIPLGDRVLVKPTPQPTRSESGIEIVEHYVADVSGTVVAVGDGIEARIEAVQRFADRVIAALQQVAVDVKLDHEAFADLSLDAAVRAVKQLRDAYRPEHVCRLGDDVAFGIQAGVEFIYNGERYLIVREDDLEAVLEPEGVS